jgi:hypothetical protein
LRWTEVDSVNVNRDWLNALGRRVVWAELVERAAQDFELPDLHGRPEAKDEIIKLAKVRRVLEVRVGDGLRLTEDGSSLPPAIRAAIQSLIDDWSAAFLTLVMNWRQADMYVPNLLQSGYGSALTEPGPPCPRCGTPTTRVIKRPLADELDVRTFVRCRVCGPIEDRALHGSAIHLRSLRVFPRGRDAAVHVDINLAPDAQASGQLVAVIRDEATGRGVLASSRLAAVRSGPLQISLRVPADAASDAHAGWICLAAELDVAFIRYRAIVVPPDFESHDFRS